MAIPKAEKIWFNGKLVNWDDAKIHVLSHVVHYGSSAFEGMRCYETKRGSACFRLGDHIRRLFDTCKIYRMEIPYSQEDIRKAILETIKVNKLKSCYVRPLVFRGYGTMGVDPSQCPINVVIAVWSWGSYLGAESLEKGVSVRVSSWNRSAPNTMPTLAKAGGNYLSSQLIKMEALSDGYAEGIGLDVFGYVSEGSGENIFVVRDGVIYTPPISSAILPGITRDSVMALAGDLGYEVREQQIPREMLYIADEVFFTGSAAEIVPISHIDKIEIGNGARGPVTERLQSEFFAIVSGEKESPHGWMIFV